ncbi:hypothetical protein AO058_09875 [Salegentibacter sp. T436]|nr:hypothetical protein AO058_09875 [Salegentibacter sp. T436]
MKQNRKKKETEKIIFIITKYFKKQCYEIFYFSLYQFFKFYKYFSYTYYYYSSETMTNRPQPSLFSIFFVNFFVNKLLSIY